MKYHLYVKLTAPAEDNFLDTGTIVETPEVAKKLVEDLERAIHAINRNIDVYTKLEATEWR